MYKFCAVLVVFCFISGLDARLDSEQCKVKPSDSKCTLGFGQPTYKPHHVRFVFDWDQQKCTRILWAYDCPHPPNTNNFETADECSQNCSGYA